MRLNGAMLALPAMVLGQVVTVTEYPGYCKATYTTGLTYTASSSGSWTSTVVQSTMTLPSSTMTLPSSNVNPSGLCGPPLNTNCYGAPDGTCCSQYGYCGRTSEYCGTGCQPGFGTCDTLPVSNAPSSSSTSLVQPPVSSAGSSTSSSAVVAPPAYTSAAPLTDDAVNGGTPFVIEIQPVGSAKAKRQAAATRSFLDIDGYITSDASQAVQYVIIEGELSVATDGSKQVSAATTDLSIPFAASATLKFIRTTFYSGSLRLGWNSTYFDSGAAEFFVSGEGNSSRIVVHLNGAVDSSWTAVNFAVEATPAEPVSSTAPVTATATDLPASSAGAGNPSVIGTASDALPPVSSAPPASSAVVPVPSSTPGDVVIPASSSADVPPVVGSSSAGLPPVVGSSSAPFLSSATFTATVALTVPPIVVSSDSGVISSSPVAPPASSSPAASPSISTSLSLIHSVSGSVTYTSTQVIAVTVTPVVSTPAVQSPVLPTEGTVYLSTATPLFYSSVYSTASYSLISTGSSIAPIFSSDFTFPVPSSSQAALSSSSIAGVSIPAVSSAPLASPTLVQSSAAPSVSSVVPSPSSSAASPSSSVAAVASSSASPAVPSSTVRSSSSPAAAVSSSAAASVASSTARPSSSSAAAVASSIAAPSSSSAASSTVRSSSSSAVAASSSAALSSSSRAPSTSSSPAVSSAPSTTTTTTTTRSSTSSAAVPATTLTGACPADDGVTATDSRGVQYLVRCGGDYTGTTLSNTGVTGSYTQCFALCDAITNCGGFSWAGSGGATNGVGSGNCYFKSFASNRVFQPNTNGGVVAIMPQYLTGSVSTPAQAASTAGQTVAPTQAPASSIAPVSQASTCTAGAVPNPQFYASATANRASSWLVLPTPTACDFGDPDGWPIDDSYCAIDVSSAPVTYYNKQWSTVYSSTNGILSFNEGSAQFEDVQLPTADIPTYALAPFWDDTAMFGNTTKRQGIYYQRDSTGITFEYYLSRPYVSTLNYHYTVSYAYARPNVYVIQYLNVDDEHQDQGYIASVGMQGTDANGASPYGFNFSYKTRSIYTGLVLTCNSATNICTSCTSAVPAQVGPYKRGVEVEEEEEFTY